MPSEQAMLMSISSLIAWMPAATWVISRSSGPRTAATMQNSVAPVLAVCLAASTSIGMSSHAERTGEANSPDCEQKWQSSGHQPVFRQPQQLQHLGRGCWLAPLKHRVPKLRQDVGLDGRGHTALLWVECPGS